MIENPIFIVGVGRSGTTLLQGMMNSHGNIAFPPETQFIRNFITHSAINKKIRKGNNEWVKKKILNDKNLSELNLNLNGIIDKSTGKGELSLVDFYKKLLAAYLEKKKKDIIGDKYPKNIEYLKEIRALFPGSYIIHIIRDPRDVVLSRLKADWSRGRPVFVQALTYREQITKGRKDGKNFFGKNYYELFYEQLIENPENELKKICNFLGLSFDRNMLKYNEKAGEIVKSKERKWKNNLFKPVISSNKNKWMSQLRKSQILQVEIICHHAFKDLGYKKSNDKMRFSFFYTILFYTMAKFTDIVYDVYHKIKYNRSKKYVEK